MRRLLIFYFSVIGFSEALLAQAFIPPMPADLSATKVSLLTVGIGEDIYARFGHTMIRVEDQVNNLDYLVNWGMFDFSDPLFVPKFLRGILIYKMSFSATQATVNYYRDVERRSVIQDELSLTSNQKRQLMEKILWNAQPENVNYPYHYFLNNCSTIPRDYLDLVTQGYIRKSFSGNVGRMTYRDYIRANLANNPLIAWGLDVVLNSDSDRKLSKWQEMFYPLKLREYLSTIQAIDDAGNADPGRSFLVNNRVLADLPEPNGSAIDGYQLTWLVAGLPLLVLLFLLRIRRHEQSKQVAMPWHFRVFGLVCIWWGLTCGFFGLTHFSGWAFSMHTDLHRNFNMMIFWPLDVSVLILGVQMGLLGRRWNFSGFLGIGFWRKLAYFHIVFIPVYLMIWFLGLIRQDVSRVMVYMAPLSLLYYLVLARFTEEAADS